MSSSFTVRKPKCVVDPDDEDGPDEHSARRAGASSRRPRIAVAARIATVALATGCAAGTEGCETTKGVTKSKSAEVLPAGASSLCAAARWR